ncbi:MAG: hypothetical protein UW63_C0058G0012 [Candidatus Uhrbacteria bacterium GW2011_GWF2_44_350]|uniref:Uncharacterized protein n=1 Tax=Candidatus Uhrbacteria bacterium GW2011_GWF2_44_350 TaxID=1619000 RepID=A0A0G1LL50_9BACT|nr:MAG: hypothetical protein UW63_C0058G0012 [Candidatus Uhrbacteria bacterium GW2011_GWF2_44_350]
MPSCNLVDNMISIINFYDPYKYMRTYFFSSTDSAFNLVKK